MAKRSEIGSGEQLRMNNHPFPFFFLAGTRMVALKLCSRTAPDLIPLVSPPSQPTL